MNTNEQAPECCPFCGAKGGGLYEGVARQYECGSWDWPKVPENGHPRESQSTKCAAAERERLTRELAESKATIKRLEAEKAFLSESHLAQENKRLVAEMLKLRNAIQRDTDAFIRLTWELDEARLERDQALMLLGVYKTRSGDLLARVKRLEEAGDECSRHATGQARDDWNAAKEATP